MLTTFKNSLSILFFLPLLVFDQNNNYVSDIKIKTIDNGYEVSFIANSLIDETLKVTYKENIKILCDNLGKNNYSFIINFHEFDGGNDNIYFYLGYDVFNANVINYINNEFNKKTDYIFTRPIGIDTNSKFIYETLIIEPLEFELWSNCNYYVGPIVKFKSNKDYEEIKDYCFSVTTKTFSKNLKIVKDLDNYMLALDYINVSLNNELLDYSINFNDQILVRGKILSHKTFDSKNGIGEYEIHQI